jgi:hypothetical protein
LPEVCANVVPTSEQLTKLASKHISLRALNCPAKTSVRQ